MRAVLKSVYATALFLILFPPKNITRDRRGQHPSHYLRLGKTWYRGKDYVAKLWHVLWVSSLKPLLARCYVIFPAIRTGIFHARSRFSRISPADPALHKADPALHKADPALHKADPALHKAGPALHKHVTDTALEMARREGVGHRAGDPDRYNIADLRS
jgi:hypothetical protein